MKDNDFLINAPEGELYPHIDNAKKYLLDPKGADNPPEPEPITATSTSSGALFI